jgi:hypothetical protein
MACGAAAHVAWLRLAIIGPACVTGATSIVRGCHRDIRRLRRRLGGVQVLTNAELQQQERSDYEQVSLVGHPAHELLAPGAQYCFVDDHPTWHCQALIQVKSACRSETGLQNRREGGPMAALAPVRAQSSLVGVDLVHR